MSRIILTILATFALAFAAGIISVALNDWFGSGDLVPFGICCIPFALLAAPAVAIVFRATTRLPVWLATACAFLSGFVFGWLGTFAVALVFGPWFGAMSVPVLQVWCTSAAWIFSAAIALWRAPLSRGMALALFGLGFFSILLSMSFRPAISLTSGDQHLTVFFFRHYPGDTDLEISDPFAEMDLPMDGFEKLDETDLALLRQTGLRGKLESLGPSGSNSTTWPRARALIILTAPITQEISLPQPKHRSIVYVQNNGEFRRIPATAPTFERQIRIRREPDGTHYSVEQSNGAQSGGFIGP
jgi:hypothetical protein